ncbi:hypothetical protein ACJW30_05G185000 [Castanea mollissima]
MRGLHPGCKGWTNEGHPLDSSRGLSSFIIMLLSINYQILQFQNIILNSQATNIYILAASALLYYAKIHTIYIAMLSTQFFFTNFFTTCHCENCCEKFCILYLLYNLMS